MECRLGCGACCIAPSINSPIPGMPDGKKAGERCIQLDSNNLCLLFGLPQRPHLCDRFKADVDVCGDSNELALENLIHLEQITS
jgi:Fe-S-cluster containining protein